MQLSPASAPCLTAAAGLGEGEAEREETGRQAEDTAGLVWMGMRACPRLPSPACLRIPSAVVFAASRAGEEVGEGMAEQEGRLFADGGGGEDGAVYPHSPAGERNGKGAITSPCPKPEGRLDGRRPLRASGRPAKAWHRQEKERGKKRAFQALASSLPTLSFPQAAWRQEKK